MLFFVVFLFAITGIASLSCWSGERVRARRSEVPLPSLCINQFGFSSTSVSRATRRLYGDSTAEQRTHGSKLFLDSLHMDAIYHSASLDSVSKHFPLPRCLGSTYARPVPLSSTPRPNFSMKLRTTSSHMSLSSTCPEFETEIWLCVYTLLRPAPKKNLREPSQKFDIIKNSHLSAWRMWRSWQAPPVYSIDYH